MIRTRLPTAAQMESKVKNAEYIETLAQRHAEAMGIPIESARSIVYAVAVTADKHRREHLMEENQFGKRWEG